MAGKIAIRTDVLAPERKYVREFKVHHPSKIMLGVMNELLKDVFEVKSSDVWEDSVKWDVGGGENVDFYGIWRVRFKCDMRTILWTKIIAQGKMNLKDKMGSVTVSIIPVLETDLKYGDWLERLLQEINYKSFYKERLQAHIKESKRKIDLLDSKIRDLMGGGTREE